jgi:hypothetical protein
MICTSVMKVFMQPVMMVIGRRVPGQLVRKHGVVAEPITQTPARLQRTDGS